MIQELDDLKAAIQECDSESEPNDKDDITGPFALSSKSKDNLDNVALISQQLALGTELLELPLKRFRKAFEPAYKRQKVCEDTSD